MYQKKLKIIVTIHEKETQNNVFRLKNRAILAKL
jgi:hypothetical protein